MPAPRVSVVIPVYNRADTIGRAMESVLAQTFEDFEVIVLDDGSSDALDRALGRYQDSRVRCIRHPFRKGAAAARNTGLANARGDFIALLDSDDEWLPEKLHEQMKYLASPSGDRPVCCTDYYLRRVRTGAVSIRAARAARISRRHLAFGCWLALGSTLVASRSCFEAVGGFDEGLPRLEDWDWLLRCAKRWPVAVIQKPLARVHLAGWPSPHDVEAACERLKAKHLPEIRAEGFLLGRKFQAALSTEMAAACYMDGRYLRAAAFLLRSFVDYPLRKPSFFVRTAKAVAPFPSNPNAARRRP